jgi:hypothetical protein
VVEALTTPEGGCGARQAKRAAAERGLVNWHVFRGNSADMTTEYSRARDETDTRGLRTAIIGQTKKFLIGLETGLSDEQLTSILLDIKEKELQLIKEKGTMLDPEMWELLRRRFTNRRNKDIIDTTEY